MNDSKNESSLQKLENDLKAFWNCLDKLADYGDLGEDFLSAVDACVFRIQKNLIAKVCGVDPRIITYEYIDLAKTRVPTGGFDPVKQKVWSGERPLLDSELVDLLEPLITRDLAIKHDMEVKMVAAVEKLNRETSNDEEEEEENSDRMDLMYDRIATLNERYDQEDISEKESLAIEEEAEDECLSAISDITGVDKNFISTALVAYVMRGKIVKEQEGDRMVTKIVRFNDADIKRLARFIYAFSGIPYAAA